jgi:SAM-dependent methyltransferase
LNQFERYIAHTDKHSTILESLSPCIQQIVQEFKDPDILVLDAGCGPGQLTGRLLEYIDHLVGSLQEKKRKVIWTCLDSSMEVLQKCKKICESMNLQHTEINYIENTLEDYLNKKTQKEYYHLVICSHILYYINNWMAIIKALLGILIQGGELWIVHVARDAEVHRLFENIRPFIKGEPEYLLRFTDDLDCIFQEISIPYSLQRPISKVYFNSKEIEDFLTGRNIFTVCSVLGFLWAFTPEAIHTKDIIKRLQDYFRSKISGCNQGVFIEYRDGIFRVKVQT